MPSLALRELTIGHWTLPAVVFDPEDGRLLVSAMGIIGNSVPTSAPGKQKLADWKRTVARAAKAVRGPFPLDPRWQFSISAGFSFCPAEHGNQRLDVENFLKPTFDALAAGLFCGVDQDPDLIERYDYDDANFRYLFVHQLPDAPDASREGVELVISIRRS